MTSIRAKIAYGILPFPDSPPGHEEEAHQPDEFIAVDQVAACVGFMERLTEQLVA